MACRFPIAFFNFQQFFLHEQEGVLKLDPLPECGAGKISQAFKLARKRKGSSLPLTFEKFFPIFSKCFSSPATIHDMIPAPGYSKRNGLDMIEILSSHSHKSQRQT